MKILFGTYIRAASCEQTKLALKRFLELEMGNFISLNISRINYEETLEYRRCYPGENEDSFRRRRSESDRWDDTENAEHSY